MTKKKYRFICFFWWNLRLGTQNHHPKANCEAPEAPHATNTKGRQGIWLGI